MMNEGGGGGGYKSQTREGVVFGGGGSSWKGEKGKGKTGREIARLRWVYDGDRLAG